eukprot:CAMPEP_0172450204 /NCGR_PEP_ID=MMETSP1065-20121228/8651_1 /TAXON_ID=265537 /ORGANISM="Amphiprora paludosa, Strain CCMP125" /LENGTH=1204 /DNA_ID=CAMNT_0013201981 /DNA_START=239 /DNA_END=3853 /DNA_ORIENTATION=-
MNAIPSQEQEQEEMDFPQPQPQPTPMLQENREPQQSQSNHHHIMVLKPHHRQNSEEEDGATSQNSSLREDSGWEDDYYSVVRVREVPPPMATGIMVAANAEEQEAQEAPESEPDAGEDDDHGDQGHAEDDNSPKDEEENGENGAAGDDENNDDNGNEDTGDDHQDENNDDQEEDKNDAEEEEEEEEESNNEEEEEEEATPAEASATPAAAEIETPPPASVSRFRQQFEKADSKPLMPDSSIPARKPSILVKPAAVAVAEEEETVDEPNEENKADESNSPEPEEDAKNHSENGEASKSNGAVVAGAAAVGAGAGAVGAALVASRNEDEKEEEDDSPPENEEEEEASPEADEEAETPATDEATEEPVVEEEGADAAEASETPAEEAESEAPVEEDPKESETPMERESSPVEEENGNGDVPVGAAVTGAVVGAAAVGAAVAVASTPDEPEHDMEPFLKEIESVEKDIGVVKEATAAITSLNETALHVTKEEKDLTLLEEQLSPLVDQTNQQAERTKASLAQLKQENKELEEANSVNEADMLKRKNLVNKQSRVFIDEVKAYQAAQEMFKTDMVEKKKEIAAAAGREEQEREKEEFERKIKSVKDDIDAIEASTASIRDLNEKAGMRETSETEEVELSRRVAALVDQTNGRAAQTKSSLTRLKDDVQKLEEKNRENGDTEKPSSLLDIVKRKNAVNLHSRWFLTAMKWNQDAQQKFKSRIEERQAEREKEAEKERGNQEFQGQLVALKKEIDSIESSTKKIREIKETAASPETTETQEAELSQQVTIIVDQANSTASSTEASLAQLGEDVEKLVDDENGLSQLDISKRMNAVTLHSRWLLTAVKWNKDAQQKFESQIEEKRAERQKENGANAFQVQMVSLKKDIDAIETSTKKIREMTKGVALPETTKEEEDNLAEEVAKIVDQTNSRSSEIESSLAQLLQDVEKLEQEHTGESEKGLSLLDLSKRKNGVNLHSRWLLTAMKWNKDAQEKFKAQLDEKQEEREDTLAELPAKEEENFLFPQIPVPARSSNAFSPVTWWMVDFSCYDDDDDTPMQGATPLVMRCIRTHQWPASHWRRVLKAYRQFLDLKKEKEDWHGGKNGFAVIPCGDVDKMWKEHIIDMDNYYLDCMLLVGHVVRRTAPVIDTNDAEAVSEIAERRYATNEALRRKFGDRFDEELWTSSDTDALPPPKPPQSFRIPKLASSLSLKPN